VILEHVIAKLAEPPPKAKKLSHREQRTALRAALGLPGTIVRAGTIKKAAREAFGVQDQLDL
jgi:hypothetical protein